MPPPLDVLRVFVVFCLLFFSAQLLPESLRGRALFPCVTFRGVVRCGVATGQIYEKEELGQGLLDETVYQEMPVYIYNQVTNSRRTGASKV